MAAVKQAVRPRTMTKEKSYLHTKRILAIAVSSIAYIRQLFPDECFSERTVDGMKVHILKNDGKTKMLIEWMAGVYDAVEKEYLKRLVFAVSYKEQETERDIVETYSFTFTYPKEGVSTDVSLSKDGHPIQTTQLSVEETKKSAQKLIRNLFSFVSTFDTIKSAFSITMRLTYYEDRRPEEYQPPGFEPDENDDFVGEETLSTTNIGKMVAPFHAVQLVVKTCLGRIKKFSGEQDCESQIQMHMNNNKPVNQEMPLPDENQSCADVPPPVENTQPMPFTQTQGTQGLGVRCACGYNEDDASMLLCVSCNYWQHAICFCVPEDDGFFGVHVCNICGDPSNPAIYPTDATLVNLTEVQLRETCMWRRALRACYETSRIGVSPLSVRLSCTKILAKDIVNKLVLEGVAVPIKGHRSYKDVDRMRLDAVFHRDVRKPGKDMRKQNAEARSTASTKCTPGATKLQLKSMPHEDDTTPMKFGNTDDTRATKRRLGIDSDDIKANSPEAPPKTRARKSKSGKK
ncbi:uncharacterized protein LOC144428142 [Styela clava]